MLSRYRALFNPYVLPRCRESAPVRVYPVAHTLLRLLFPIRFDLTIFRGVSYLDTLLKSSRYRGDS